MAVLAATTATVHANPAVVVAAAVAQVGLQESMAKRPITVASATLVPVSTSAVARRNWSVVLEAQQMAAVQTSESPECLVPEATAAVGNMTSLAVAAAAATLAAVAAAVRAMAQVSAAAAAAADLLTSVEYPRALLQRACVQETDKSTSLGRAVVVQHHQPCPIAHQIHH